MELVDLLTSYSKGRSGELLAEQPKAAGGSLLQKLTHYLLLDALRLSGLRASACVILPVATGMSISLTLMTLKHQNPSASIVLWPRIDQKTCLKCIVTVGLVPVVIPNVLEGEEVRTDLLSLEKALEEHGKNVLAVLSTTSCFAPRGADKVVEIAKLCKEYNVSHVINNAYGVQSSKFSHLITEASRVGRVDAFVQSTDKNFLVPVGGAIVASISHKEIIDRVSKIYPGRASISPVLDLFITLLSLGSQGYQKLLQERKEMYKYFAEKFSAFASHHGERILRTPNNPLSLAMTLTTFSDPTRLAGMLFAHQVSGTRVVAPVVKTIEGISFQNYGAHMNNYPWTYVNASVTLGLRKSDIDKFLLRFEKILLLHRKQIPLQELSNNIELPEEIESKEIESKMKLKEEK